MASPSSQWAESLRSSTSSKSFRIPGPSTRFHKEHQHQYQAELQQQQLAEQERLSKLQDRPDSQSPRPKYARFSTAGYSFTPTTRSGSRLSVSPSNAGDISPSLSRSEPHRRKSSIPVFSAQNAPLTPVRSPRSAMMNIRDRGHSPYSDYFTDENRSVEESGQYVSSSCESQKLLLRLNTLGADILRQDRSDSTTTSLGAKLDDLEAALNTSSQSRRSSRATDFDLGIQDIDQEHNDTKTPSTQAQDQSDRPATPQSHSISASTELRLPDAVKARLRNQDRLLREAQDVLNRVSKANDSLRKRYDEIRQIHDSTVAELEECGQELLEVKSENEALKADLAFDHSELLFMKLQVKALEIEADAIQPHSNGQDVDKNRVLLDDDIDRWKADWDDVDARLRARRETHKVISTTPEKLAHIRETPQTEVQGNWRLDMCKRRQGRVQSITIKRLNAEDKSDEDQDELVMEDLPIAPAMFRPICCQRATQTDDTTEQSVQTEEPAWPKGLPALNQPASKPVYREQLTQTTEPFMTRSEWEKIVRGAGLNDQDSEEAVNEADEQLIAEEEQEEEEENEQEQEQEPAPPKTAWQELYDGLVSFAGMDKDP
ncbi:hypothetical protein BDV97DRAFT_361118 [Delphinella strobiligena]|nr:hypothetical protein BDV97DRAFT_361118 [Delphinella strobiligena]